MTSRGCCWLLVVRSGEVGWLAGGGRWRCGGATGAVDCVKDRELKILVSKISSARYVGR